MGVVTSHAESKPDVMPWWWKPKPDNVLEIVTNACLAAGKRPCTVEEWHNECTGPNLLTYVYGNDYDPELCNSVNTYCDDYCEEFGIVECDTTPMCGYSYNVWKIVPTGLFPDCISSQGTYDITGNVWEIVVSTTSETGYEVRGGAANCGPAVSYLKCSFSSEWSGQIAGFRCCKDAEGPP